jgi:hypothetical protein
MHQYQLKQECGRWTLTARGGDQAICTFESKKGALACCSEFARTRSGSVAVLGRDGKVERFLGAGTVPQIGPTAMPQRAAG